MTNLLNTFLNTSIGFDPFFDGRDNWLTSKPSYPFYNIKKESENKYIIEIALAGFAKEDIDIHQTDEILTIEASEHIKENNEKEEYISKGVSKRWFRKQFQLADTVEVKKVKLENGMLSIHLENNRPSKEKTFDID